MGVTAAARLAGRFVAMAGGLRRIWRGSRVF